MNKNLNIQPTAGQRLDRWLKKNYALVPFGSIQKALRTGQIRLNGKRVKGDYIIQNDDVLRIPPQFLHADASLYMTPKSSGNHETLALLKQRIIFEDESCIILNKPAGLAVQGGTNLKDSVDLYTQNLTTCPVQIVHRLDKDTSGLLIMAKSLEATQYYGALFKNCAVEKVYQAVVVGKPIPNAGLINLPLGQGIAGQKEKMTSTGDDLKKAITRYKVTGYNPDLNLSWITFYPQTGRKHQIRVHAAEGLKCPILGDGKYGGKIAQPFKQRLIMHLCATGLKFQSQTGELIDLQIETPDYFIHNTADR